MWFIFLEFLFVGKNTLFKSYGMFEMGLNWILILLKDFFWNFKNKSDFLMVFNGVISRNI